MRSTEEDSAALPPLLEDPVKRLLSFLVTGSSRVLIGLAGVPGAGKSTLAMRLGEQISRRAGPNAVAVLGMDGFHFSKAKLDQFPDPEAAFRRRGAPWTFDAQALAERLGQIRQSAAHQSVWWPDFQHEIGDPVENAHEIRPDARLVLVEGLYLLHQSDGWDAVRRQFDELWYLDIPLEIAMERLTLRHMNAWGISREAALRRIEANDRLNAEIVTSSASNANWRLRD